MEWNIIISTTKNRAEHDKISSKSLHSGETKIHRWVMNDQNRESSSLSYYKNKAKSNENHNFTA